MDPRSEMCGIAEAAKLGCWQGGPGRFQCIETLDAHPGKHDVGKINLQTAIRNPVIPHVNVSSHLAARARVVVAPCPTHIEIASRKLKRRTQANEPAFFATKPSCPSKVGLRVKLADSSLTPTLDSDAISAGIQSYIGNTNRRTLRTPSTCRRDDTGNPIASRNDDQKKESNMERRHVHEDRRCVQQCNDLESSDTTANMTRTRTARVRMLQNAKDNAKGKHSV